MKFFMCYLEIYSYIIAETNHKIHLPRSHHLQNLLNSRFKISNKISFSMKQIMVKDLFFTTNAINAGDETQILLKIKIMWKIFFHFILNEK